MIAPPRLRPRLLAFTPRLPSRPELQRARTQRAEAEARALASEGPWLRAGRHLTQAAHRLGRGCFAADGLVPALTTTASVALLLRPHVTTLVRYSAAHSGLSFAGVALGVHVGAAAVVTGLVLATTCLALAQTCGVRRLAPGSALGLGVAHLPQAALGAALAPCVTSLPVLGGPVGCLTLAATVGLSAGLAGLRCGGRRPSLLAGASLLGGCLLAGPGGWALACGMATEAAVALATGLCALAVLSVAATYAAACKVAEHAPTPYFAAGVLAPKALAHYRFEAPDAGALPAADATIFDVHPELWSFATQLREEIGPPDAARPFRGFCGQPVRHLYGPAGGGKTLSTLGFANAIGAHYRGIDANELEADNVGELPIAAINAVTLLLEADAFGRARRRPVVVLLDEVDAILPSPEGVQDNARINKALGFNLLVHTLRLLQQNRSYVVLFTATNRYQAYEPLLRLLGQHGGVQLQTPTVRSKGKVFRAGLRQKSTALRRDYGYAWAPALDAAERAIDRVLQRCARQNALSARSMANLVQVAMDAAVAAAARQPRRPPLPAAADAVTAAAFAAMHAELDAQQQEAASRRPLTRAQTQAQLQRAAPPPPMTAREQTQLDKLLHDMGLRDTSAVRIFQTLAENLAHEYVKPANAMRLATIKLRLANVFWLMLLHFGRNATEVAPPREHHQVYVPTASAAAWLPSPRKLAAAALRAANLQWRATRLRRTLLT